METFGSTGDLPEWLKSYLTDHKQRVILNDWTSEWRCINAGVPQGSILGPLLFFMYANDIVDNIKCDPSVFADDNAVIKILNKEAHVRIAINDQSTLHDLAAQWRVTFKAKKTVSMYT